MRKILSVLTALGALLLAPLSLPQQPLAQTSAAAATAPAPSARVIVKYKTDSILLRRQALVASAGEARATRAQALGQRIGLTLRAGNAVTDRSHVVFASGIGSAQLAERLSRMPDIEYAVPDQRRHRTAVPNDPRYASGPPLVPATPTTSASGGPVVGQWYLRAPAAEVTSSINVEPAWDFTVGSASVVVAVLDTGVRFDHPDMLRLAQGGRLLDGYDMIGDAGVGNDGDSVRDADASDPGDWVTEAEANEVRGEFYQCTTQDPVTGRWVAQDSSWHGMQTAGIIAADTGNAVGMAGVARGARLLPVRVLGKCGGFDSDIIAGMLWAAGIEVAGVPRNGNPARVLNLSLGSAGVCTTAYQDAIDDINALGAVVVASAGNSAGHAVHTPANCAGVISVAGLRHVGTKVGFSDIGPEISLSAPGGNCIDINPGDACQYPVLTTSNSGLTTPVAAAAGGAIYTDAYNPSVGTSFSAPLVAGTTALMLSVQPGLTAAEVLGNLQLTARAFPTSGGDNGDGTPVLQCVAPYNDAGGDPVDQLQCYCTTATCGAGMLDAGAAVASAASVQPRITTDLVDPVVGETVTLSGVTSLPVAGSTVASYVWTITDPAGVATSVSSAAVAVPATMTGVYVAILTVTDATGISSTASGSFEVAPASVPVPPANDSGGGGALDATWLLLLLAAVVALGAPWRRRRGRI